MSRTDKLIRILTAPFKGSLKTNVRPHKDVEPADGGYRAVGDDVQLWAEDYPAAGYAVLSADIKGENVEGAAVYVVSLKGGITRYGAQILNDESGKKLQAAVKLPFFTRGVILWVDTKEQFWLESVHFRRTNKKEYSLKSGQNSFVGKNCALMPCSQLKMLEGGKFKATGADPWFLVNGAAAGCWIKLEITGSSAASRSFKLYIMDKKTLSESDALPMGTLGSNPGKLSITTRLPAGMRMLRLDPGDSPGEFTITSAELTKVRGVEASAAKKAFGRLLSNPGHIISRTLQVLKTQGIKGLVKKVLSFESSVSLRGQSDLISYPRWQQVCEPDEEAIKEQVRCWKEKKDLSKISIAVPVWNVEPGMLREMIESVIAQTYPAWQLVMADGASSSDDVRQVMREYAAKDSRITNVFLKENLGIAGNSNAALKECTGDIIALLDHDDILPPWALNDVAVAALKHPEADMFYTDEDKIVSETGERCDPHFKPDFNIDMLRSINYICHFLALRRSLWEKVGGFNTGYDGAQDYDLILRASEMAQGIVHIPHICYHWRIHSASTAMAVGIKPYVIDASIKAIDAHLARTGTAGKAERGATPVSFRVRYSLERQPLVSILIPNKDNTDTLDVCLSSLYALTEYKNLEVIVIENNSVLPETFDYYRMAEEKYGIKLVTYDKQGFNYSLINNFGAQAARGEYLLLLNNDTQIIEPDWLTELVSVAVQPGVAAVGALLLYPDDTIQHAGVIMGMRGIAGHAGIGKPRDDYGYFNRYQMIQRMSAVTAACMMVDAELFRKVGGLKESYQVAFNDIDLCMRLGQYGRIVYDPFCKLYHHESKSRGQEDTPEKVARFKREIERLQSDWGDFLEKGDPMYNPNLSLMVGDYLIKARSELDA